MDTVKSSGFDPLVAAADLYNADDYSTSVAVMDAIDAGFAAYAGVGLTPSTLSNLVYNLNLDYFGKYIFAVEELASLQEDVMSALAFIPSEVLFGPILIYKDNMYIFIYKDYMYTFRFNQCSSRILAQYAVKIWAHSLIYEIFQWESKTFLAQFLI